MNKVQVTVKRDGAGGRITAGALSAVVDDLNNLDTVKAAADMLVATAAGFSVADVAIAVMNVTVDG